ncbi:MAG: UvrD-helicase domain-containing protein [Terriglobales bacterium]
MRVPTGEQQDILDKKKIRVRIVRAVPGSGKTWLIAELIRQELATWPIETSGIAALSFTKIAGEEIRRAVGHQLAHPHFVGTIDAFLFRYVLRPHLSRVFKTYAEPRIVVGEWGPEYWGMRSRNKGATVAKGKINLFGCIYINEKQGKAIPVYKPHPNSPFRRLTEDELSDVREAKLDIWKTRGLFTHSDASLWASKILEHPSCGPVICAEITRRFPILIVDELQDTGHFLGKSIRLLLEQAPARGMLVGDPDQAIYEFNGARPDLFDAFETISGAVSLPLSYSRRCPSAVARSASHLKDGKGDINSAQDREGRTFLIRYQDMVADVRRLLEVLPAMNVDCKVKVIARATTTVDALKGRKSGAVPSLNCPPLTHIHRAVVKFRQGKTIAALGAARAAIERSVFKSEGVTDEELLCAHIDPGDWKALAVRCLLKANALPDTATYFEWQSRAGQVLDREIIAFNLSDDLKFATGKLKPKRMPDWQSAAADFLPQMDCAESTLPRVAAQTVHGVKGETHDTTVFVCPPPANAGHCPSKIWWSVEDQDREEKRIAYVAMTRTQGDLIVCVSKDCYKRLADKRPEFVASFSCMTVTEFIIFSGNKNFGKGPLTATQYAGKL